MIIMIMIFFCRKPGKIKEKLGVIYLREGEGSQLKILDKDYLGSYRT